MATKTVVVGVRMTRKLAASLRRMASESQITRSELLTSLVEREAVRRAAVAGVGVLIKETPMVTQ